MDGLCGSCDQTGGRVNERVERYQTEINGKQWDVTVIYHHNPTAHRDAQEMFTGMIVQHLMDRMFKEIDSKAYEQGGAHP